MAEEMDDPKLLDEHLAVKDEEGHTVLQVALLATVYFEKPYERGVREAVVACCEHYIERCGPHLFVRVSK